MIHLWIWRPRCDTYFEYARNGIYWKLMDMDELGFGRDLVYCPGQRPHDVGTFVTRDCIHPTWCLIVGMHLHPRNPAGRQVNLIYCTTLPEPSKDRNHIHSASISPGSPCMMTVQHYRLHDLFWLSHKLDKRGIYMINND